MTRRKAFTLVELLVVIAIIALLMAILLPALQRAKEQGKTVVCRNQLRQYGVMQRMYLDDFDGRFASAWYWLFKPGSEGGPWPEGTPDGPLWPYIKNEKMNLCPSFKLQGEALGRNPRYSYSANGWLGAGGFFGKNATVNEFQVKQPATIFMFSEENPWRPTRGSDNVLLGNYDLNDNGLYIDPPPGVRDCFATYHNIPQKNRNEGWANLVFVDGHCEKIIAEDQKDGGNYRMARPDWRSN